MDTFRKWLNKPKADDKSLLARFYHADRALTAVASELDSFDGRAEPDRCSRLVSRLRQGQDKVLSITNQIMEELLGDDRAPRTFRAKFPEEVLQENLAGQLWFGAECLAAGSSIMNRELESTAMRPLAQAVTKSLDNVRNLLRDQCLRNNIPNSPTLKLDFNDSTTEQLYESLKIFDRLFAEFELRYVSAMVQVKSKHEYEIQELICVLFSETLQRALRIDLLEQEQVDSFDPALMFSIPRLAIICGLIVYNKGPLNMDMPADQLSEMYRPFRTILIKIRDLLRTLNKNELYQLEKLLCTNEDIHLKSNNNNNKINCDDVNNDDNKSNSDDDLVSNLIDRSNNCVNRSDVFTTGAYSGGGGGNQEGDNGGNDGPVADDLVSSIASDSSSSDWTDDDSKEIKENLVTADCASGYLIPNTNFGNLFQPNEAPLTDNFIGSDDEYNEINSEKHNRTNSNSSTGSSNNNNNDNNNIDSGISTETGTTGSDRTPDSSDNLKEINENSCLDDKYSSAWKNVYSNNAKPSCSRMETTDSSEESEQQTIKSPNSVSSDYGSSSYNKLEKTSKRSGKSSHRHCRQHSKRRSKQQNKDTSSGDTSSSLSDGDPREVTLALRAAGRMKFKSTENLLHRLFVCIAGVADQLQTNFASDLRQILRSVFLMNMTPAQEEIQIPKKTKDSDLFEFRASENDVIPQNAGSNQSIYSAEEVNPEMDNVFSERRTSQRGNSLDVETIQTVRNNMSRSRSLGEEHEDTSSNDSSQRGGSFLRDRPSSQGSHSGSNSPANSSASNSPVGGRMNRSSSGINTNTNSHYCPGNVSIPMQTNTATNTQYHHQQRQQQQQQQQRALRQSPPPWIPDDEAPRCMACTIPFTAFRRRHHCRNCGGVFCGGCSSSSAPLPKYGLKKAVRVCRECYVREVSA